MELQHWEGGYIHEDSARRKVFYIRKQLAGKRFHFSLQTGDLEVALREYRRFRDDPHGYELLPRVEHEKLLLTARLVKEFLDWSRDEKKSTHDWVLVQQRTMAWWTPALFGKDLRKLSLRETILPKLKKAPGRCGRGGVGEPGTGEGR